MDLQDLDTCLRCCQPVEGIREQAGSRCPTCGVRLDVTHSIAFDEQGEAQRLGFPNVLLLDGEHAEIIGGHWHIVRDGEESRATGPMSAALDRLLGFIYRTATIDATEGDY